ncbi:spore coat U domain-containing protein [Neorhizobium sp. NCHU2750]|uniref:Csu type fimbrial protein n=1 Tax=Neorhizobium sp. NCHU2750 TaxID=1825976 RepID=UPI000E7633D0|nr:spore coat protein U [Neorhizobium sp. NCHU2750]
MRNIIAAGIAISFFAAAGPALAQTATTTFNVTMTITSSCQINSATNMDFGSSGVIAANRDATSTITVQCTNGTGYTIGLNAGSTTGGTIATRLMSGAGGATIGYSLYSDVARNTYWGNTIGTNTVSGTGNGAAQPYTVYGRVPPQTTPAAGPYTDTVTATLNY